MPMLLAREGEYEEIVVWEDPEAKAEAERKARERGLDLMDVQSRKFMLFFLDRDVTPAGPVMDRKATHEWAEEHGEGSDTFKKRWIMVKEPEDVSA